MLLGCRQTWPYGFRTTGLPRDGDEAQGFIASPRSPGFPSTSAGSQKPWEMDTEPRPVSGFRPIMQFFSALVSLETTTRGDREIPFPVPPCSPPSGQRLPSKAPIRGRPEESRSCYCIACVCFDISLNFNWPVLLGEVSKRNNLVSFNTGIQ